MSDSHRMSGQLPLGEMGYGSPGHTGAPGAGYPQPGPYQQQQPYYAQESRPSGGGGQRPPKQKQSGDSSGLALKILGLVAVALVSGFAFWFFSGKSPSGGAHQSTPAATSSAVPAGKFQFTAVHANPFRDSDCSAHSSSAVQQYFKKTQCQGLIRSLYSTQVNGKTVYTSVSVVQFASDEQAAALKALADKDNTGNVNDVLRDRLASPTGAPRHLGNGGYASTANAREVIIAESDFAPSPAKHSDEDIAQLKDVSRDAFRLADSMRNS